MCHWSYWCICRHKSLGQSNNWLARITVKASHFIYEGLSCVLPSANLGYSIAIFKYERGTSVRSNLPPPLFGGFNQPPRSILTICLQLYGSKALSLYHTVSLSLWLNCISTSLSITPIYSVLIYLTSKNKSQLGSLTCSDFFSDIMDFGYFWTCFILFHTSHDSCGLSPGISPSSPWPLIFACQQLGIGRLLGRLHLFHLGPFQLQPGPLAIEWQWYQVGWNCL
jgi:hypothetical protein